MWETLGKRFSVFAQNSNIHGFKFIANEKENELSRLFWVIVFIVSGGCLYLLLLPVIQRSEQISFTPDTLYLDWTTAFPAVTVCETYQTGDATKRFKKFYPELSLVYNKLAYYSSLLYGEGRYSPKLSVPCGEEIPCDLPWRNMSEKVRRGYDELMADCVYNGRSFPCSQHFHVVDSEHGPCFSFNTLQNKKSSENGLFVINRTTGPSYISFHLLSEAEISVHSNEELSTNALDPDLKVQVSTNVKHASQVELLVSTVEMRNDLMLHFQEVEERMCRFPYEVPRSFIYSYLISFYRFILLVLVNWQEKRKALLTIADAFTQLEIYPEDRQEWRILGKAYVQQWTKQANGCISLCAAISHKEKYCNFTGLNCLLRYEVDKFLKHDADEADCMPSCVESELKIIHKSFSEYSGWFRNGTRRSLVTLRLASLPTLRYQRNMLRTELDLVVTIGGLAGLFFGASILSLTETFYLIFRKTN